MSTFALTYLDRCLLRADKLILRPDPPSQDFTITARGQLRPRKNPRYGRVKAMAQRIVDGLETRTLPQICKEDGYNYASLEASVWTIRHPEARSKGRAA